MDGVDLLGNSVDREDIALEVGRVHLKSSGEKL